MRWKSKEFFGVVLLLLLVSPNCDEKYNTDAQTSIFISSKELLSNPLMVRFKHYTYYDLEKRPGNKHKCEKNEIWGDAKYFQLAHSLLKYRSTCSIKTNYEHQRAYRIVSISVEFKLPLEPDDRLIIGLLSKSFHRRMNLDIDLVEQTLTTIIKTGGNSILKVPGLVLVLSSETYKNRDGEYLSVNFIDESFFQANTLLLQKQ